MHPFQHLEAFGKKLLRLNFHPAVALAQAQNQMIFLRGWVS
jgi:hypothetical protein